MLFIGMRNIAYINSYSVGGLQKQDTRLELFIIKSIIIIQGYVENKRESLNENYS